MAYIPRLADEMLAGRLADQGAVMIEGPKGCGKSTAARRVAGSCLEMDHPLKSAQYQELAEISPGMLLSGNTPRLIDEWQLAGDLWDAVCRETGRRQAPGQFILTGSAIPAGLDQAIHDPQSPVSRMVMRPMSLYESGESNGEVSLADLFGGKTVSASCDLDIPRIVYLICRGGWPRAVGLSERNALRQAQEYLDNVIQNDILQTDGIRRDPEKVKRLLISYAGNLAAQTPLETFRTDMDPDDPVSNDTLYSYLGVLRRLYLLEDAPAWVPELRTRTAIRMTDTRYFTDPSVAAAAMGLGPQDLVENLNLLRLFFENLCIRDLRIYTDVLGGTVRHYRDKTGLECDAVLCLGDGRYGLAEICLGGSRFIQESAERLNKLTGKIDPAKMPSPSFRMVLTGITPEAYRRDDGIYVVSIGCLKP